MRKPPPKKTNSATLKGNLTFQTKFSNRISTSSSLLPITPKNTIWYRQRESQKSAHHISIMGNFLTKPAKWSLLNKKEIDEDWATKRNWICNDQLCPNPYTHARGDPCKLTMEDLFPSRPEPPTSEDTRQPEDKSEDWLIEWDRENRDRKNN
jgi:hypothetical protein